MFAVSFRFQLLEVTVTNHKSAHSAPTWIALAAIQATFLAGCGNGTGAQAASEPKGIVLGLEAAGKEVELAQDDVLTVKLPSQHSTGYT